MEASFYVLFQYKRLHEIWQSLEPYPLRSFKKLPILATLIHLLYLVIKQENILKGLHTVPRLTESLAKNLKCKVVAEGVETNEQLNFLKELECEVMLGYLFSKPLPVQEITALLQENKTK